ncbi:small ribosomal subunit protein uS15-like [Musca vetustissima]|uniref:small ribosomal subunit protein uS15-like n=1 Tax=Musca vetustissima TaxID=27455 RepID=UPI002AB5F81F|nr:small ribosomal subunit protein uS15-like [Musca vetustissima]
MGRMHAPGKGISQSVLPYRRTAPLWLKINANQGQEWFLQDSNDFAQVGFVNDRKILRIMKSVGIKADILEYVYHSIKKPVAIRKHLKRNGKDKDGKFRLILFESLTHRLARYQ